MRSMGVVHSIARMVVAATVWRVPRIDLLKAYAFPSAAGGGATASKHDEEANE